MRSCHLLEFLWCLASLFFKESAEVWTIAKSQVEGNFLDRHLTMDNLSLRLQDNPVMDNLCARFIQFFL